MLCQVYGLEHPGKSAGMRQVMSSVYTEAGILGFWSGNFANVVRIIPNKGILFMCNDKFKQLAGLEPNKPAHPLQILAAGSMSGVTTTVLTYPLDLVRSRLMMSGGNYKGIADCISKTVRAEGWSGLYAGMGPTVAGIVPYQGINFMCYDVIKRWCHQNMAREDGTLAVPIKLSIGAISGMISQTASYPIDTVRRRMQLQGTKIKIYTSSIHCFSTILKQEGPVALYRGLLANVLRAGPNAAVQFLAYEQLAKAFGLDAL